MSDDLIRQIKESPISAVVGQFISLQKSGSTIKGLCPFHPDRKPSLVVNDTKKLFKCFACDVGGDAITFVQKFKHLDFREALRECAKILGLSTDELDRVQNVDPERLLARKILSKAVLIYGKIAADGPHPVFQDFLQARALHPEIAEQFQLGFAPHNSALTHYLESIPHEADRASALQMALKIGLILEDKNHKNRYYDKFRDRIMFPIWDHFGHIQGFTARAIRDEQQPKYLNSNESFVFSKKSLLYGLHFAKPSIRELDQLILCEGNMDAIALFQHGFKQSVAIMGTAMNEFGLSHIRGLTKNIWLALDSDGPGMQAAQRSANLLHKIGIMPKYLDFSPYKDPDELLKNEGALSLQKRMDEAPILIDYLLAKEYPEKMPELIEQKQALLLKAFTLLAPLGDSLSASERIMSFAQKIGLKSDSTTIRQEYQSFLKGDAARLGLTSPINPVPTLKTQAPISTPSEISERPEVPAAAELKQELKISKSHTLILRLLLENPLCLAQEKLKEVLDLLESDEIKQYVGSLRDLYFEVEEAEFVDMALAILNQERWPVSLKEVVGAILFDLGHQTNGHAKTHDRTLEVKIAEKLLKDLYHRLEEERQKTKRYTIKERQLKNDTLEGANFLLEELNEVQKKLHELNKTRRKTSQVKEL